MVWYMLCSWGENAARGLVYSLFVARTTWFGLPDVCSKKGEWEGHGVECHEMCDGINLLVGLTLGGEP